MVKLVVFYYCYDGFTTLVEAADQDRLRNTWSPVSLDFALSPQGSLPSKYVNLVETKKLPS